MSPITLPLIDAPPYWRATTPAELGLVLGEMPGPTDLVFPDGWTLAFYAVATKASREARFGWVRSAFAVCDEPVAPGALDCTGALTHLPTGRKIADFANAEEAAFAAEVLAPLIDWPAVTDETPAPHGHAVRNALFSAGFVVIACAVAPDQPPRPLLVRPERPLN